MQSLFPQREGEAGSLIAFNAGKCNISAPLSSGKVAVTPDMRKGRISLDKSDGLMHFKWTDRETNHCEDDIIIFPGDLKFKRVNTGRADDRVFLLKVGSTPQNRLFWMQDKSAEKDKENVDKLHEMANNPQAGGGFDASWMQMMGLDAGGSGLSFPGMGSAQAGPPAADLGIGHLDLTGLLAQFATQATVSSNPAPVSSVVESPRAPTEAEIGQASHPTLESNESFQGADPTAELFPSTPQAASSASRLTRSLISLDGNLDTAVLEDSTVRASLVSVLPSEYHSSPALHQLFVSPPCALRRALEGFAHIVNDPETNCSNLSGRVASLLVPLDESPLNATAIRSVLECLERYFIEQL